MDQHKCEDHTECAVKQRGLTTMTTFSGFGSFSASQLMIALESFISSTAPHVVLPVDLPTPL
jgi:hypothetical protein